MKAKRSILGLILVIGMLLSCVGASYAADATYATAAPKFTTTKLESATHGEKYSQTISVDNIVNSDTDSVAFSSTSTKTTLGTYGIDADIENGAIKLTADELTKATPSAGIKFKVKATNKWKKNATDEKLNDSTVEKEFTLKILAVDPTIVDPSTDKDISKMAGNDNYPVKGTAITDVEIKTGKVSPKVVMTATGLPKGLRLEADEGNPENGEPDVTTYKITGTPTEAGKFNITVTAANADTTLTSKKATAKYTMSVIDVPGLNPAAFKDVTYGKDFSQKFKVTGVTADAMPKSGTVTFEPDLELDDDYDKDTGVFTISGKVTADEETLDERAFSYANSTSIDVTFEVVDANGTSKEIKTKLKILAVAPTIANETKTAAQEAVSKLKIGEEMDELSIAATGPGHISWDIKGTLPAGITSSEQTVSGTTTSTLTLSGTPTVTAKNQGIDIIAKNGKGEAKLSLKFTIGSDNDPVVTFDPTDVTETGDRTYSKLQVNSGDVKISMSAKIGDYDVPVTWKAAKLPKGLTLTMSPDARAKTSVKAQITGKATAAMKDTDEITITATDPNTGKSKEYTLKGVRVYPKPTLKKKKLPDVKIGEDYEESLTADGVTSWIVSGDTYLPTGLTFSEKDVSEKTDKSLKLTGKITQVPTSGDTHTPIGSIPLKVQAVGPGGKSDVVAFDLKFKGEAPKFETTALEKDYSVAGNESNTITIVGTSPMTAKAYIAANDAKAIGITTTKDITLNGDMQEDTGFTLTSNNDTSGKVVLTLSKTANKGGAFKKINITVEADNGLGSKPAKKVFKAVIKGDAPVWKDKEGAKVENNAKIEKNFKSKTAAGDTKGLNLEYSLTGAEPMTVTLSPAPRNDKVNELEVKLDYIDKNDHSAGQKLTIKSTTDSKAVSTKLTVTAKNAEGTSKFSLTLNGQEAPVINEPRGGYSKEGEQGKKLSLALSLKSGTKPVTWAFADANDALVAATYGLTIDAAKGKIEGTPTKATLENDAYKAISLNVWAGNAAGSSDKVPVTIGVKGSKPKLADTSKSFTSLVTNTAVSNLTLAADGIAASEMKWSVAPKGSAKTGALSDYVPGLTLTATGEITGAPTAAGKNISVPVIMNHHGNEQKAKVKFTVVDPQPVINPDSGTVSFANVEVETKSKDNKAKTTKLLTKTLTFSTTKETNATGASTIKWKASKPDNNLITVKVENADQKDTNVNSAKVTVSLPLGKRVDLVSGTTVKGFTTTFTLTATNTGRSDNKDSTPITITVNVASGGSTSAISLENETIGDTRRLDENDSVASDEELKKELGEGELTIGTERTVGMLTDSQAKVLDDGRFVIAAILPEISATADGQYGLEVDIAENVKAGAKLYWFAFPKDAASSEDDTIIDFFDVSGTDTEVVPEDHTIVAYPWFREGVTYGPVIAVKAEDAESGEAVTEGELEETAESEAESETKEVEVSEPAEETEEAQETETEETETTETTEE